MGLFNVFAPVAGPGGIPVPPSPSTVAARIEDEVAQERDKIDQDRRASEASGTRGGTVTAPNGATGQVQLDDNVVTVDEFNNAVGIINDRLKKMAAQISSLRTGLAMGGQGNGGMAPYDGSGGYGYDASGGMFGGGGGGGNMMPMLMMFMLLRGGLNVAVTPAGGAAVASPSILGGLTGGLNPSTRIIVTMFMLMMFSGNGGGMSQPNQLMPFLMLGML
jgi:hypothetical protein